MLFVQTKVFGILQAINRGKKRGFTREEINLYLREMKDNLREDDPTPRAIKRVRVTPSLVSSSASTPVSSVFRAPAPVAISTPEQPMGTPAPVSRRPTPPSHSSVGPRKVVSTFQRAHLGIDTPRPVKNAAFSPSDDIGTPVITSKRYHK